MKIVAVIPAFNESKSLQNILPKNDRIIFLRHPINLGKGAAMKTGVDACLRIGTDIVVFLDADGQHNPAEIPRLTKPLIEGRDDIVFGVRNFQRSMPFVSKMGNMFLTRMASILFRIYIRDTQSGFRAFRTAVYRQLYWGSSRYAVETEMIVNAGKHHLRWTEAEISTIYLDKYRGTTVLDGMRIFINMIAWRLL